MSRGETDPALQRLVADLAKQPRAEIAGVLRALPVDHRDKISALLTLRTHVDRTPVPRISPWLSDRLMGSGASLTPHALATLRDCAREIAHHSAAPVDITPSLLDRITSTFMGRTDR